jgi:hypothetical protein
MTMDENDQTEPGFFDSMSLNLVPPVLHDRLYQALATHDADTLLTLLPRAHALDFLQFNTEQLGRAGIFEKVLLAAYAGARDILYSPVSDRELARLLDKANRLLLRAAGNPLPGRGPFTLYRGVDYRGPHRLVRGFSWTPSFEEAQRLAGRDDFDGDPSVYRVEAEDAWVLACLDQGGQHEFLLKLPATAKVQRVWRLKDETRGKRGLNAAAGSPA